MFRLKNLLGIVRRILNIFSPYKLKFNFKTYEKTTKLVNGNCPSFVITIKNV